MDTNQPAPRRKFNTVFDWNNLLVELSKEEKEFNPHKLRIACYKDIEAFRKKPLLVYAANFIDKPQLPNSIDLEDIDGFIDMISTIPKENKEVDILVHSPGGNPAATERIVNILRNRFQNIDFLVPHSAYSAATMLALSGNNIILHSCAVLGPIDPQIGGRPARTIKRGFENIKEIIRREGPKVLPAYIPLIEKYSIELLEICDDSEILSKELVTDWLLKYMFNGDLERMDLIKNAVEFFADYDTHRLHSRPLVFEKLSVLGLNITKAENELDELLREAYILLNGFFGISNFVKIYETTHNLSWGKQINQNNVKK